MKLKTGLILISVLINVILGWNALNAGAYILGKNDGSNERALQIGKEISAQLELNGEFIIPTPNGDIVLVHKRQNAPAPAPVQPVE